jgi:hypothetical protein
MLDLKPYFDAVNAAKAEEQRVANEIDVLFKEGSDEGKVKALALRPALEDAQNKLAEAVELYESMQLANRPNDVAKNFIPISNTPPDDGEGSQPTIIKRQEYDRLSLIDRAKFVKSGGTLIDD